MTIANRISATEGFTEFAGEFDFVGRWEDSIDIQGEALPWALEFGTDSSVRAEFPDRTGHLPAQTAFRVLLKGDAGRDSGRPCRPSM